MPCCLSTRAIAIRTHGLGRAAIFAVGGQKGFGLSNECRLSRSTALTKEAIASKTKFRETSQQEFRKLIYQPYPDETCPGSSSTEDFCGRHSRWRLLRFPENVESWSWRKFLDQLSSRKL